MFTSGEYRDKAVEYGKLVERANSSDERRKFRELEQSYNVLADNEQWLSDNQDKIVRPVASGRTESVALSHDEAHILRRLGAALVLQWNTVPEKLRRELFDEADSMSELLTGELREKMTHLFHKPKNDEEQNDPSRNTRE